MTPIRQMQIRSVPAGFSMYIGSSESPIQKLEKQEKQPFLHLQSAGRDDKVGNKNEEAVMFKKYSWLIYVFIIAFLLPGNFICLWGLKIIRR